MSKTLMDMQIISLSASKSLLTESIGFPLVSPQNLLFTFHKEKRLIHIINKYQVEVGMQS